LLTGAAPEALAARDPQGNTALHVAVLRHSLGAVRALLAAGASPEAQNARKWTPLDEAIALKDREAVKLLLE
jgi:ankyrin repeat protein